MNRDNLEKVNNLMGKLRRLEAGVKAIIHDGGEAYLHVRKGNNDLETGILISTKSMLAALHTEIDHLWPQLEKLGVERGMPGYDLPTSNALKELSTKYPSLEVHSKGDL